MIKVAPSILSADFANLGKETILAARGGADYIHIDVMDGTFVPNITLGSPVVASLKKAVKASGQTIPFDVHLMVEHPETQIESFAKAGADIITFQVEAAKHHHRVIQQIKSAGCKAGIALNPGTSLASIEELLPYLDLALIMTVNPGYGGQKFIETMLEKIHMLRHTIEEMQFDCELEVDGGINEKTSRQVQEAGANVLVAGSAVYDVGGMSDDERGKRLSEAIATIRGASE